MTKDQVRVMELRAKGDGIREIARKVGLAPSTVVEVLQKGPDRAERVLREAPLAKEFLEWHEENRKREGL